MSELEGPGVSGELFGLPLLPEDANLVILPVPWEVTVSYGAGTAGAPAAILQASSQVDLYDGDHPDAWRHGIAMAPIPDELEALGARARKSALRAIDAQSSGRNVDPEWLARANDACESMVEHVRAEAGRWLAKGKRVAVLGGDHSVPLGLLQALAATGRDFGILHVDAHCDLRVAYEGFVHSHASIMHNALSIPEIVKIVQVGVRDFSDGERQTIAASGGRVELFEDRELTRRRFEGETWASLAESIVAALPERVYVSFDIDGLDPSLCPGTGTPVPGGLGFEEALWLVERVLASGRSLVGFDLCEVSPGGARGSEWDANVGARVLYRLSAALSSGHAQSDYEEQT